MAQTRKKTRRAGQGSVYQRKDGRWEGSITHGYNEKGNPIRHRTIKKTQAEAVKALNEMISRMNLGVPVVEEKQTVADFLAFWLKEHVASKAPKTQRFYEQMIRLYIVPSAGHLALGKLTAQHVQALVNKYAQAGLSPSTVSGIRATLRAALNTAWRWNLIRDNPASKVTLPRSERQEPVYLSVDEAQKLIEVSREHYLGRLFEFALLTGLRIGEATGLRWEDVDFSSETVKIRGQLQRVDGKMSIRPLKSDTSRRVLALSSSASGVLKSQKAEQLLNSSAQEGMFNTLGLCFTGIEGRPLDPKTVDKHLKSFAKKVGVAKEISFHKLRHTVATHMAASGVPLSLVKDQLGHSQISLTSNTYSHAVPTALRGAADTMERVLRGTQEG